MFGQWLTSGHCIKLIFLTTSHYTDNYSNLINPYVNI